MGSLELRESNVTMAVEKAFYVVAIASTFSHLDLDTV